MRKDPSNRLRKDDVRKEIDELHQFFADWFNGRISSDKYVRFEEVTSETFELITPSSDRYSRGQILSMVRNGYNSQSNRKIWTEHIETRFIGEIVVATYHELQKNEGEESSRLSSAIFRYDSNTPNNCVWEHVHETWV